MGMYGYIYITENIVNCKKYIGKHKSVEFDTNYLGSSKIIKKAIKEFGKENFTCSVLEWCESKEILNKRERYWISESNAVFSSDFYNIAPGGDGLNVCEVSSDFYMDWKYRHDEGCRTNEFREGVSKTVKDKWENDKKYREVTTERIKEGCNTLENRENRSKITTYLWERDKYREAQMSRRNSDEFRELLSVGIKSAWDREGFRDNQIRVRNTKEYKENAVKVQKESHNTKECKEKQSKSAKEMWKRDGFREKRTIPIRCVEMDKEFKSVQDGQEWLSSMGLRGSVIDCLRGRCKTSGGYSWEYVRRIFK